MTLDGFEVYFEMRRAWRSSIRPPLRGMEPRTLVALVKLAGREGGIPQAEAASRLKLRRWGLSKIKKKLLKEQWITEQRSQINYKEKVMTATPKAQFILETLQVQLTAASKPKVRGKSKLDRARSMLPGDGLSFFDPPVDDQ